MKSTEMQEIWHYKVGHQKDTFYSLRADRALALLHLSWEHERWAPRIFHYSVQVCEYQWKHLEHWLWVTDPSQRAGESANMECTNDENWLYFLLLIPSNFVLIETFTTPCLDEILWAIFPLESQTFHFPLSVLWAWIYRFCCKILFCLPAELLLSE